jgi:hypothetical protein
MEEPIMNTAFIEARPAVMASAYGGLADAIGGIAAAVIAIVGLTGFHPELMAAISVIVFGAALLIQGGTLLSEYAVVLPTLNVGIEAVGDSGISSMFLAGAAGIVLGILALLGVAAMPLTSISIIAFGAALVLSSSAVSHLSMLQSAARRMGAGARTGTEMLAGEMASGSAGVQLLSGLTGIVLGILSLSGERSAVLALAALLVLGVTFILTGSALSGLVASFMHQPSPPATRAS